MVTGYELEIGGCDMARFKAERMLKVLSVSGREYWDRKPAIRLSGEWVRDLGFEIDEAVRVRCEPGKLTVSLASQDMKDTQKEMPEITGGVYGKEMSEINREVHDRETSETIEGVYGKDMSEIIEGAYGTGINKCDGADNGNNLMVAEGKLERSGI